MQDLPRPHIPAFSLIRVLLPLCLLLLCGLGVLGWFMAGSNSANAQNLNHKAPTIQNVRFGVHPDHFRIAMDISGNLSCRVDSASNALKALIACDPFVWQSGDLKPPPSTLIRRFSPSQSTSGQALLVLDSLSPVRVDRIFTVDAKQGTSARLVIDYVRADEAKLPQEPPQPSPVTSDFDAILNDTIGHNSAQPVPFEAIILPTRKPPTGGSVQPQTVQPIVAKGPWTIILDPGHGGQDPGAIAQNGVREKDVVLKLAFEIERLIKNDARYRVHMTRSKDVYIKLNDRVKFARARKADLFLSVHADSVPGGKAQGASFYTLSEKATDQQTAKLAARENLADIIAGVDLSHEDKDVADILIDLATRDTVNHSRFMANKLTMSFKQNGIGLIERPHRSAGFAVLKAPDIPAVLIEAGFLSSPVESRRLTEDAYLRKLASSIKRGIDLYFEHVATE